MTDGGGQGDARPDELGLWDVFLSYAREDRLFAERLAEALRQSGQRVWLDLHHIPGGAPWQAHLERGLEACKALVIVLSPDSLESENCRRELSQAEALNKLVIPIHHRDFGERELPAGLAEPEWIFLGEGDGFEAGVAKLVDSLSVDYEWREQHTRLAVRTREWLDADRDKSFLMSGSDLKAAEAWLLRQANHSEPATPEQTEYVIAGRRTASGRRRRLAIALLAALLIVAGLGALAFAQRNEAEGQRQTALSRSLAVQARELAGSNLDTAALLAVEAYRLAPTIEARDALLSFVPRLERANPVLPREGRLFTRLTLNESGDRVAVGDEGGVIRWLDTESGKQVAVDRIPSASDFNVGYPNPDESTIALAGTVAEVEIWDRAEQRVRKRLHDPEGGIPPYGLAQSPDGKSIALNHETGVRVWSTVTGRFKELLPRKWPPYTYQATFSPDGQLLASATANGCFYVWEVASGRRVESLCRENSAAWSVAFSHDGSLLAGGNENGVIRVWRLEGSAEQIARWKPHSNLVEALAFDREDATLASIGRDGVLSLRAVEGEGLARFEIERNATVAEADGGGAYDSVGFDGAGDTLAVMVDGRLRIWDAAAGDAFGRALTDEATVDGISPDGKLVAVAGEREIVIWNRESDELTRIPWDGEPVGSLEFTRDGRKLAAQSEFYVVVWDPRDGELLNYFPHGIDSNEVGWYPIGALSPNGQLAANVEWVAEKSLRVRIWDLVTGELVKALDSGFGYEIEDIAFSPNGKYFAAAGSGPNFSGAVRLWETADWRPLGRRIATEGSQVSDIAFSPDSRTLATAGENDPVWLLSVPGLVAAGAPLFARTKSFGPVLEFSPDGATLATVGEDSRVRFWDLETQLMLGEPLTGNQAGVSSLRFTAGGDELISVDGTGHVHAWDGIYWSSDYSRLRRFICDAIGHDLSPADWEQFVRDEPYHATCA